MPDFLKRLPPQQRNIAIAGALGAVLALFVIARRRGNTDQGDGGTATTPAPTVDSGSSGAIPDLAPSTFADNGAAFGEINTTLTGLTGELQTVTDLLANPPQAEVADTTAGTPSSPAAAPTVVVNLPPPAQLASTGGAVANAGNAGKTPPASGALVNPATGQGYVLVTSPNHPGSVGHKYPDGHIVWVKAPGSTAMGGWKPTGAVLKSAPTAKTVKPPAASRRRGTHR